MDINSKILLGENEVFQTSDVQVKDNIVQYRNQNDRYFSTKIADMELFVRAKDETPDEFRKRTQNRLSDTEINGSQLFLKIMADPDGSGNLRRGFMPVRGIAFRSILERARLSGFTLINDEQMADCSALPLEEKAEFINKCFKLYSGTANVLYRDRQVTSVMSAQYYPIGVEVLDSALQEGLQENFSNVEFKGLTISQEFFSERYYINDEETEEDIALMFNDAGLETNEIHVCVDAYTGDHGNIAATYVARLEIDDKSVSFGKPVSVKHSGKKSKESLVKAAKKLYKMFRSAEKALQRLMATKIEHPDGCIRMLAKEFHLPKAQAMEVAAEFELRTNVTGYEIYFALNDIIRRADVKDFQRSIQLQEAVAETLTQDYTKYDKVFLWARKSKSDMLTDDEIDEFIDDLDDAANLPDTDPTDDTTDSTAA